VIGNDIEISFDPKTVNHNLLFFPGDFYQKQIIKDYPQISTVVFTKKYPDTLVLKIDMREAFACVGLNSVRYVIDDQGFIIGFDTSKCLNLPEIKLDRTEKIPVNKIENQNLAEILNLIKQLQQDISVKSVSIEDSGLIQMKFEKTNILFTQDQPIISLSATLQTLIRGFRMKGIMPTSIDLRYNKPIIIN
jgi:cell division septal protein FtsQ